jgi:hypothetical protein
VTEGGPTAKAEATTNNGGIAMKRFKSARGGASVSGVLSVAIIAFLIYEGIQFIPVLINQYQFKDELLDAAKFSLNKKEHSIKQELTKKAAELGIPVTTDMLRVTLMPARTRIQVKYRLSVEWLPGKTYTWEVDEVAESAIF